MGPSCFGGYKIRGLWRLDPQRMNGKKDSEKESERWRAMWSPIGPQGSGGEKVEGRPAD